MFNISSTHKLQLTLSCNFTKRVWSLDKLKSDCDELKYFPYFYNDFSFFFLHFCLYFSQGQRFEESPYGQKMQEKSRVAVTYFSLPGKVLVYACCLSIIISNSSLHSGNISQDDKLYDHPKNKIHSYWYLCVSSYFQVLQCYLFH